MGRNNMKHLNEKALVLSEDTVLDKDYSEDIIVGEGKTLTVEGYTNRLIVVNGGTVIVKGTCGRINCVSGKVQVEHKGLADSIFALGNCNLIIDGFVREIITRENNTCILNKDCICYRVFNNNSNFTLHDGAIILNYEQVGTNAKIYVDTLASIVNYNIKECLFY